MGDEKYPSLAVIIPSYFVPQQLSKALFGSVGWVGRYPGDVANSTSLERDGMTILHGAQPTIFRANSSLLRTNGTAAAREMVGWVSHKLEGHGRKQALNQPQTPGFHPTLRSPTKYGQRWVGIPTSPIRAGADGLPNGLRRTGYNPPTLRSPPVSGNESVSYRIRTWSKSREACQAFARG